MANLLSCLFAYIELVRVVYMFNCFEGLIWHSGSTGISLQLLMLGIGACTMLRQSRLIMSYSKAEVNMDLVSDIPYL